MKEKSVVKRGPGTRGQFKNQNRAMRSEVVAPFGTLDVDERDRLLLGDAEDVTEEVYAQKELQLLTEVSDRAAKHLKEQDFTIKKTSQKGRSANMAFLKKVLGRRGKNVFKAEEQNHNPFFKIMSPARAGYRYSTEVVDDEKAKASVYVTADLFHCLFKIHGKLFPNCMLLLFLILRVARVTQKASLVEVMDAFMEARRGMLGYSLLEARQAKTAETYLLELERVGLVYSKLGWIYYNVNYFYKGDRNTLLAFLAESASRKDFPFPFPDTPKPEEYQMFHEKMGYGRVKKIKSFKAGRKPYNKKTAS